jgi:hypothetical protein
MRNKVGYHFQAILIERCRNHLHRRPFNLDDIVAIQFTRMVLKEFY